MEISIFFYMINLYQSAKNHVKQSVSIGLMPIDTIYICDDIFTISIIRNANLMIQ